MCNLTMPLFASALFLAACASSPGADAPAPEAPAPEAPAPEAPGGEPVATQAPAAADPAPDPVASEEQPAEPDMGCVAAIQELGVLKTGSKTYKSLRTAKQGREITQTAVLRSGEKLVASVGGCAHMGASYTFSLPSKPARPRAQQVRHALELLAALDVEPEANNFRDDITRVLGKALDDGVDLDMCYVSDMEITTASCRVATSGDTTEVVLSWDIAL